MRGVIRDSNLEKKVSKFVLESEGWKDGGWD